MMQKIAAIKMAHLFNKTNSKAEEGMVTAEYALGTVATTGIAGILIWLSQQEWLKDAIASIFKLIVAGA